MPSLPFTGSIPDDLLYDPEYDMWVRLLPDGEALIGATAFGIHQAGEIIAFTSKPNGATVARGRGMGTVECRKTLLAVHAPISFILRAGNEAAEERPKLVNSDPYSTGWMARVQPTNWAQEQEALVDAAVYRAQVQKIDPEARFV